MKKMIVDSMSLEEVMQLLLDDVVFLQHKIDDNIKKYKKLASETARKTERHYYSPLNFRSACGFNYVIQFFKRASSDEDKGNLGQIYYAWFVKNRGVHAIIISRTSILGHNEMFWRFSILTPHFLDRYRERFLKDITISKPDVVYQFLMRNLKMTTTGHPSKKYPNSVWSLCNDGLCLCSILNNFNTIAKTFVTFDMSGKERKEFISVARDTTALYGFEYKIPDENFDDYIKDEITN